MRGVKTGLLLMGLIASAAPAHAQGAAPGGWNVTIDFLQIETRGNDVHVGDIFTERQTIGGTPASIRFDYGVEYEPLVTEMDSDQSVLISAGYRGRSWGFGVRGWRTKTDASLEGRETSAAPTSTSQSITGVRLWENSIIPVTNMQEASDISPVPWHAENELDTLRIDVFAERLWVSGDSVNVASRFGLSRAHVENSRAEGQTQRAFIQEVVGGTMTTFANNITLEGESESEVNLTGPMLAFVGDSTFSRVRVDWLLGSAVLVGTTEASGLWTDIDDITEMAGGVQTTTVLHGELPVEFEERVAVPVLETEVKVSFVATRNVRIGAGVFSSSWFNLPVAPGFIVPDDWTDVQGTAWRQQRRDITYTAFSIFAGFTF